MHWIDPNSLPEVAGTLDRFTPNPNGKVDGLVLGDGTFIHFPPHMSEAALALVHRGEPMRPCADIPMQFLDRVMGPGGPRPGPGGAAPPGGPSAPAPGGPNPPPR